MKIVIETEPCKTCDFSPSVCGEEIEFCMTHGNYNDREKAHLSEISNKESLDVAYEENKRAHHGEKIHGLYLWDKRNTEWVCVYHGYKDECEEYLHRIYPSVEKGSEYCISAKKPKGGLYKI